MSRKILFQNFFSLSIFQIANYILPLITVPYIVRIIGAEKFGLISFAQAFVAYFILIVNYGFNLSSTREISIYRHDSKKVSEIFSATLTSKFILFAISTLLYTIILLMVKKFNANFLLHLIVYVSVIGEVLLPVWLFQGLEKLKLVAFFNFAVKLIFTFSVFVFLKSENQYLLVPASLSLAQLIVSISALLYALNYLKVRFILPHKENVLHALKSGKEIFASTIVINFYTTSNTVILGFFAPSDRVGYFAAGVKLISAVQGLLLYPLNQTLYPYLSKEFHLSKWEGFNKLKKITLVVGFTTLLISLVIYFFAKPLVLIFLGEKFYNSISVVKIISFFPFIIGLSNIFGIQGMLNLKMDNHFLLITSIGAILNFALNFILAPIYAEIGTAISWLITEVYITLSCALVLILKNKDFVFNHRVTEHYIS